MPVTVKARDGQTDLYGLMYQPVNLDTSRKYPIVNHIYPGPQTGSVERPQLFTGPGRRPGAGRTGICGGGDRRYGDTVALQEIS